MPILRGLSEVVTLSQRNNRLDYNIIYISAVLLVGRVRVRGKAADDRIVVHDGASIITTPRYHVDHIYATE
jgi:hypothetical protein